MTVVSQLDDISPAAYRPLKQSYLQNARLYHHALLSERVDRLQSSALQPLRKIYAKLKEADSMRKCFEHESKVYYDYIAKVSILTSLHLPRLSATNSS